MTLAISAQRAPMGDDSEQQLEDRIHVQMQKLHALCVSQRLLSSHTDPLPDNTRLHLAIILEEACDDLQALLDLRFQ